MFLRHFLVRRLIVVNAIILLSTGRYSLHLLVAKYSGQQEKGVHFKLKMRWVLDANFQTNIFLLSLKSNWNCCIKSIPLFFVPFVLIQMDMKPRKWTLMQKCTHYHVEQEEREKENNDCPFECFNGIKSRHHVFRPNQNHSISMKK